MGIRDTRHGHRNTSYKTQRDGLLRATLLCASYEERLPRRLLTHLETLIPVYRHCTTDWFTSRHYYTRQPHSGSSQRSCSYKIIQAARAHYFHSEFMRDHPLGWKALYAWRAPSIVCTRPKKMVKVKTKIATQKVYHCTPFRLSYHH